MGVAPHGGNERRSEKRNSPCCKGDGWHQWQITHFFLWNFLVVICCLARLICILLYRNKIFLYSFWAVTNHIDISDVNEEWKAWPTPSFPICTLIQYQSLRIRMLLVLVCWMMDFFVSNLHALILACGISRSCCAFSHSSKHKAEWIIVHTCVCL